MAFERNAWKFVLLTNAFTQVTMACYTDDDGVRVCFYNHWYFWFSVIMCLAFIVACFVVFVRGHQAKRARIRHQERVISQRGAITGRPKSPPPYGAPSQAPPSYRDLYDRPGAYSPPPSYQPSPANGRRTHPSVHGAFSISLPASGTHYTNHAPGPSYSSSGINPSGRTTVPPIVD